jgi:hypothetical protein
MPDDRDAAARLRKFAAMMGKGIILTRIAMQFSWSAPEKALTFQANKIAVRE